MAGGRDDHRRRHGVHLPQDRPGSRHRQLALRRGGTVSGVSLRSAPQIARIRYDVIGWQGAKIVPELLAKAKEKGVKVRTNTFFQIHGFRALRAGTLKCRTFADSPAGGLRGGRQVRRGRDGDDCDGC